MAALDTNILVRFLVQDDASQLAAARHLIQRCLAAGEALFVPVTVALDLEWVLRARFGFAKPAVLQTLSQLLGTVELVFESERALEMALLLDRQGAAEFADALHLALGLAAGQQPL